ncbi:replication initiator protein A [Mammaliicoccus sciuri]|uniref:replication initiator protein A n=1 Tax=Mammaliicoccus sciuri TaxID=1296 RepID=UPI001AAECC63|nr:replication initiator protein A [Mammaliicoccus sciuri]MBO3081182.1 replication initiator protein A [Mammaliicoccus sciuri]
MQKTNNYKTRSCHENDINTIESYKLHKFLFVEKKYTTTSIKAKLSYMFYINKFMRTHQSENSTKFTDHENRKYIVYTNKELSESLNCSLSSIKRAKQELIDVGLIEVVKTKGRKESKIYPLKPEISSISLTYINKDNERKLTYYAMPKFLFNNDFYKSLELETKLLYPILKDRYMSTLIKADTKKPCDFKDERGRIYCIYTNTELESLLNISEPRIIKSKKQLVVFGLLKQVSIEMKGTNKLYVYTPLNYEQMTVEDIQEELTNEKKKYVLRPPEKAMRVQKYIRLGFKKEEYQGSNIKDNDTAFKDTLYKDTNTNNDMYDMYNIYSEQEETLNHSNQSNHLSHNQELELQKDEKEYLLQNYPKHLKNHLINYAPKDIKIIKGILNKGKKSFNTNYDRSYTFEDIEHELVAMLRRIRLKLKKNQETVAEAQGLIMSSLIYEYKQFDKALKLEQLEDLFDPDTDTYVEPFEEFITKHLNNSFNNAPSAQRMKLDFVKATEAELDELGVY